MTVLALVAHARDVPAAERARFAARLREVPGSGIVLETCHRVEAYAVGAAGDPSDAGLPPTGGRRLTGDDAIRHAVAVAVGRDSVVVGEDQVLHQLRTTIETARRDGRLDPLLDRLFALALRAGRRARSWRDRPPRSLADVALDAIEGRVGAVAGRDVLVVGAGRMGFLAARAATTRGASVSVSNRTAERAAATAARTGAAIQAFDPRARIDRFAGILVALGGPWTIGLETADALARGEAVVVDLSVPPALPARLAERLGPRLITVDQLAVDEPPDARTIARRDALIDETVAEFRAWIDARNGRAAAAALAARAERERGAELEALWRRLPELDPEARAAIDRMSRHLAGRLLREPLERLGRDGDGEHERAARELFGL